MFPANDRLVGKVFEPFRLQQDLGEWIGATSHSLFNFPPGVRPVPLEIHIQGFDIVNFDSRLQAMARPTYANLVAATNEVHHSPFPTTSRIGGDAERTPFASRTLRLPKDVSDVISNT
jgi:hypothetical protein